MTALAWNGLGLPDAALVGEPMKKGLFVSQSGGNREIIA